MKKQILLLVLAVAIASGAFAQNVGIGTTTPTQKLQVVANTPIPVLIQGSNANFTGLYISNVSTGHPLLGLSQGGFLQASVGLDNLNNLVLNNTASLYNVLVTPTGQLKIEAGSPAIGKVLTSDASGLASWQTLGTANNVWALTGNAATSAGTNFLGTTDAQSLMLKVNNEKAGYIDYDPAKANTGFGYQTFNNLGAGIYNTAFGNKAMVFNTAGSYNTAAGVQALEDNQGSYNTATGALALSVNNQGANNTANGFEALAYNVAGSGATAIGAYAMLNANNTTTAYTNEAVAVGLEALRGSDFPGDNTGTNNTALGAFTLHSNSSGSNNVASGMQALLSNSTGQENTASGTRALFFNTSGSHNTALGAGAGYADNASTTGDNNTFIGYHAGNASATQLTNATAIGYNAKVDASNAMVLGGTGADGVNVGIGITAPANKLSVKGAINFDAIVKIQNNINGPAADGLYITAGSNSASGSYMVNFLRPDGTSIGRIEQTSLTGVTYNTTSDKRLKNIIGESRKGLADLMKIKIYDYTYKGDRQNKQLTGFMAQELFEVFPQSVTQPRASGEASAEKNPWMVDYGSVTPLIVKAVQDQQVQIELLKTENAQLKAANEKITSDNASMKSDIEKIKAQVGLMAKAGG